MKSKYGKILVLMGGWSNERDISLISGNFVYESLISSGLDVIKLDLKKNNINKIKEILPDRVFIVLHGEGGEDGEIQEYLESLNIPYTGSSSESSKVCMNKIITKNILIENNILTPKFKKITNKISLEYIESNFKYPFVIKPASEGSSIGVYIVEDRSNYKKALSNVKNISNDILVEQYINGIEYTVGIIKNAALPVIKLIPPGKFYDYDAKYNSNQMQYICPSGLKNEAEENLRKISLDSFKILECFGWGRVDIIIDNDNTPWVIELNTVPGMTKHSLVPMAAKEVGIDFNSLVIKILDSSFK
ncbi:MAG: D-alanine--D-alanine ligase [Gammaproteobacteria bacterium]|jgi:D-alanine-D-alanine ligase|nr:D-alanine--D-alanine ligase [Gammaproteobacteria bacterium]MBT7603059.1 D-alanine--D-alanine ligase [Gammaproteobacteria bacterium]